MSEKARLLTVELATARRTVASWARNAVRLVAIGQYGDSEWIAIGRALLDAPIGLTPEMIAQMRGVMERLDEMEKQAGREP